MHTLLKTCPPLGVPLRAIAGVVSLSTHRSVAWLRIVPVPPGATVAGALEGERLAVGRLLLLVLRDGTAVREFENEGLGLGLGLSSASIDGTSVAAFVSEWLADGRPLLI